MDRTVGVRARVHRWASPTLFALVALCFLLSFATVNLGGCDSENESTSFTGIQMVTRSVPLVSGCAGCDLNTAAARRNAAALTSEVEKNGSGWAQLAFGAAIVGLVLGLLGVVGGGWCAVVGIGALLGFSLSWLDNYQVSLHAGFWLALLVFVWAGILHLLRRSERRQAEQANAPPESATPP